MPPQKSVPRLADALRSDPNKTLCAVCTIRRTLTGEDSVALEEVLALMVKNRTERNSYIQKRYSSKWLASTLTANGYAISHQQIIRWVRRKCDCK